MGQKRLLVYFLWSTYPISTSWVSATKKVDQNTFLAQTACLRAPTSASRAHFPRLCDWLPLKPSIAGVYGDYAHLFGPRGESAGTIFAGITEHVDVVPPPSAVLVLLLMCPRPAPASGAGLWGVSRPCRHAECEIVWNADNVMLWISRGFNLAGPYLALR